MAPISASLPSASRKSVTRLGLIAALVLTATPPQQACADPIELKLSYFGSQQQATYLSGVKPFVDAVNAEGNGLVNIRVYFNGTLGRAQAQQPQLVLDGGADMAFLVPGVTPYRFPDNALLELPGLFDSAREGTLAYTRLIAEQALHGYDDFLVLGAYTAEPDVIHSRKPTGSLDDLKGQKIRANNPIEADALADLGVTPTVLEMPRIAQAIQAGSVDGTSLSPTGMIEFGIARVAPYHYLLRVGSAPFVLVMSRKRFAGLPQQVQTLIGKYTGNWTAARWASTYEVAEHQFLAQLSADPKQHVVTPTPADLQRAQRVYQDVSEAWAANSSRNRELLQTLRKDLAAVRSGD